MTMWIELFRGSKQNHKYRGTQVDQGRPEREEHSQACRRAHGQREYTTMRLEKVHELK